MLAYDWQNERPIPCIAPWREVPANDNLDACIDSVTEDDAAAVKRGFWTKFAEVRPHFGRLGRARDLLRNVVRLFEMLIDPRGVVPWRTTAGIVFALAYFISSVDLIPDAIPVLGFLDDAFVVAEVVFMFSTDIARYEESKRARTLRARSNRAAA